MADVLNVSDLDKPNIYKTLLDETVAGAGNLFSSAQENLFYRGVLLFIRISSIPGGTTLTVTLHARDENEGIFTPLIISSALGAAGTNLLTVYPGITDIANVQSSMIVPVSWVVQRQIIGAGPVDYSISSNLML